MIIIKRNIDSLAFGSLCSLWHTRPWHSSPSPPTWLWHSWYSFELYRSYLFWQETMYPHRRSKINRNIPGPVFLKALCWAMYRSLCIQHRLHASSKSTLFVTKCSQTTRNSTSPYRLKITQTWTVYFEIMSKTLGNGWKKRNWKRIMIRPKLFACHHQHRSRLKVEVAILGSYPQ